MKTTTKEQSEIVDGVYYPSSDGKPMAETDIHVWAIIVLFEAARDHLRGRRGRYYTAANIYWYWNRVNRKARCAPDIMVVRGVQDRHRLSFRSWEENGAVPTVIFEITSKKTWKIDLKKKRELYARLGVREYYIFDPQGTILNPPLRGFRLKGNALVELEPADDGSLNCKELGLRLIREGQMLRLIDLKTREPILTREEQIEQVQMETEKQRLRAEAAESENVRLRNLLAGRAQQKNGGSASQK